MGFEGPTFGTKTQPIGSKGITLCMVHKENFDLYVRGEIPPQLSGFLLVASSRRSKDRRQFSRWHDSQADLFRLDLSPGKPGRIKAHLLSVDPWHFGDAKRVIHKPYYRFQPNHGLNVQGDTLWATNLLYGAPLEIDLRSWLPNRDLSFVATREDAPQLSSTSHFAFSLDGRHAFFHQSALEQRKDAVHSRDLSLIRLDTRTGSKRIWRILPPPADSGESHHNFHSAFYYEDGGRKFVGLLRTGATIESLAPHKVPYEHKVVPMPRSTIWILDIDDGKHDLQAELLAGIADLKGLALSHLDVDARGSNGCVLYANYKQADVAEETHGRNVYGEEPPEVTEHYAGMTVEPLNYGLVFRCEIRHGRSSLRTFSRSYEPGNTSLGHSWLPINVELDSRRERLFCSFSGFRPRLLPQHIARAYPGIVVDHRRIRHVPPLLMRFRASDMTPDYDSRRTYLSYAEPMAFTLAAQYPTEFVCTFSPELGLRIYAADDLSRMVCNAISPRLMNWKDSHFRPDPAHMVFIPQ